MTFEIYMDDRKIGECIDGRIHPEPGYERLSDEWNGDLIGYDGHGDLMAFMEGLEGMRTEELSDEEAKCLLMGLCFSTHVPYSEGYRLWTLTF